VASVVVRRMPGPDRRAATVPGAHALIGQYETWLALDGRGSACYRNAAWAFLGRWPQPEAFASASLQTQLGVTASQRPFVTFLMLIGRLRPGYDYLAHRKIGGLLAQATASPWADDLTRFAAAATDLDYTGLVVKRTSERVVLRLLIQTGRPLSGLTVEDLDQIADAFARCAAAKGNASTWANDRGLVAATHRVLFHLGVLPTPPEDPRQRHGLSGHYSGVPDPLRRAFLDYCGQAAATRAPATIKAIASHLAGFGRFLASCDPPVTNLADLHRHPHIEAWLTALAQAQHGDGRPMSVGHRRGQILTVRQFFADITEWGWPDAPARALLFARDIPSIPHALPRYLPPDADHRLQAALRDISDHHPSALSRLHADALLLIRATGLRIGELRDLELDCVHEIDGLGAWLKVPLGKLASERMLPVDDETLAVLDRIAARRTPGRPLPHPRTGRPVDFLLLHQGRRLSAQALREELARSCQAAGLPHHTPHALRHTYATALVNSGLPLQALMHLLGHVSATMSLRYGRLFDDTVRAEYDRALAHAQNQLAAATPTGNCIDDPTVPRPPEQIPGGGEWKIGPTLKTRLAGGYCLRAPVQGPCSYANICEYCPAYRTDPDLVPVLAAQRLDTHALADDALTRGWDDEVDRHHRLLARLDQLINQTQST
jgi:integrase